MTEDPRGWIPLKDGLGEEDRAHVQKILQNGVTTPREGEKLTKVGLFLRDRAFFKEGSVDPLNSSDWA